MRVMRRTATVCLLATLFAASGCTTEAWYQSAKSYSESNCRKQPPGAMEECMARLNNMSYDAYEKERAASR